MYLHFLDEASTRSLHIKMTCMSLVEIMGMFAYASDNICRVASLSESDIIVLNFTFLVIL